MRTHRLSSAKQRTASQASALTAAKAFRPTKEIEIEALASSMPARLCSSVAVVRWCSSARTASR
jgi:hypothetical protein